MLTSPLMTGLFLLALQGTASLEPVFLRAPSAAGALATSQEANRRFHFAGTPGDYAFAEYMRARLAALGFRASLETFTGRIDLPDHLSLELENPSGGVAQRFDLREGRGGSDPDAARPDAVLPFNYGSGDGDVRARYVYANRGLDADYAALSKHGVSARGAIVLVRYGAEFRGLLAERAIRNGAAGVIFYSDPRDDGAARGAVYPRGSWRPLDSVQRGEVSGETLHVPTLPVTMLTAAKLLAFVPHGPGAYGRSSRILHLVVKLKRRQGTMWNTIGVLRGRSAQEVILGGHRDAWVYGVTDNGAGISTLLEVAKSFSALARTGWRPERTIVIAGWDAEEIGALGSIAYVAAHRADLRAHGVAYLNADENVTGPAFASDAAAAIGNVVVRAADDLRIPDAPLFPDTPAGGSDHESFLFGLGMPIAEVGYQGHLGVYHSSYDDIGYATKAIDPGFRLHQKAARILGLVALRLADDPSLPYAFVPYINVLQEARATLGPGDDRLFRPLDLSIEKFATAAEVYDARRPAIRAEQKQRAAITAAQELDLTVYGASGYASSFFPAVSQALVSGDASVRAAAVERAAAALDSASASLEHASSGS